MESDNIPQINSYCIKFNYEQQLQLKYKKTLRSGGKNRKLMTYKMKNKKGNWKEMIAFRHFMQLAKSRISLFCEKQPSNQKRIKWTMKIQSKMFP